jgi:hypothetical protein
MLQENFQTLNTWGLKLDAFPEPVERLETASTSFCEHDSSPSKLDWRSSRTDVTMRHSAVQFSDRKKWWTMDLRAEKAK